MKVLWIVVFVTTKATTSRQLLHSKGGEMNADGDIWSQYLPKECCKKLGALFRSGSWCHHRFPVRSIIRIVVPMESPGSSHS